MTTTVATAPVPDPPSSFKDYFILLHMNVVGIVGSVFLFMHPDNMNFAAWCGLVATLVSGYHWLVVKDGTSTVTSTTGD